MSEEIRVPWEGWSVVKQIGKGSYGTVYEIERAVGNHLDKAAMKVISIPPNSQALSDYYSEGYDDNSITKICDSYLEKTVNEYKLMRSLDQNANIVSCEDIVHLKKTDSIGWDVFIRMELLTPFLDYLKNHSFDTEEDVIKFGKDICQALIQCEKKDIIHRDVKPSNIFVTEDGDYKLGDFGVARTLDHATNATRVGTEKFMAPEVVKRKKYGKNVDVYSLGLVMYWLLNERRMPFLKPGNPPSVDEAEAAYSKRLAGKKLPFPVHGPSKLKAIVMKACAYNPNIRYQSASEMLEELKALEKSSSSDKPTAQTTVSNVNDPSGNTTGNSWDPGGQTIAPGFIDPPELSGDEPTVSPEWKDTPVKDKPATPAKDVYDKPATEFEQSLPEPEQNLKKYFLYGFLLVIVLLVLIGVALGASNTSTTDSTNKESDTYIQTQAYTNDSNLEIIGEVFEDTDVTGESNEQMQYVFVKNNYDYPVDILGTTSDEFPEESYAVNPGEMILLFDFEAGITEVYAKQTKEKSLDLVFESEYVSETTCNCRLKNLGDSIDCYESLWPCAVFYKNGKIVGADTTQVSFPYIYKDQSIPVSVFIPDVDYDEIKWCLNRNDPYPSFDQYYQHEELANSISINDYLVESETGQYIMAKINNKSTYELKIYLYLAITDHNNNLIYSDFSDTISILPGHSYIDYLGLYYDVESLPSDARREYIYFVGEPEFENDTKDLLIENQTDTSLTIRNNGSENASFSVTSLYFKEDRLVSTGSDYIQDMASGHTQNIVIDRYPIVDYDRVEWYVY